MRTTTLGPGGPQVGVIGLGCMGMTASYDMDTPRDEATSISVIHQALDLGATLIDTADVYGPFSNEELVGRALAGARREQAVLATKVGLVRDTSIPGETGTRRFVKNGRPEHVRAAIDASLTRLGTDHVELYQLHRVDPEVPIEETWGAMAEVVKAGKAHAIGLSEVTVEEIRRAQSVHPVASVQSELSLWTRDVLAEVLPYAKEQGIAILPFSPLGRGFLAGRFQSFDDLPKQDMRRGNPRFQQDTLSRQPGDRRAGQGDRRAPRRHPGAGRAGLDGRPGRARRADPRDQDPEVPAGQRRRGRARALPRRPGRPRRPPRPRGRAVRGRVTQG
jgi:aryl-alcohol dehydrogenase-like predicted oxidoreductase